MSLCVAATLRRAALRGGKNGIVKRQLSTKTNAAEAAEQLLQTFSGRSTSRKQFIDGNQLQKLSLTLNRPQLFPGVDVSENAPPAGTPLPPGYHLVYFTPNGVESELGPDGTDRTFNAPAPFTRRMWAGGKMMWKGESELVVGEEAEERTQLLSAKAKKSRDGSEMVLVEVEKQFWTQKGLALVDQRSWIFRPEVVLSAETTSNLVPNVLLQGPSTIEDVKVENEEYPRRQLSWSPVGLFRFSALTFNGHKIHYDETWSRNVESHRGSVVHGPLNLINMLDYWRDVTGEQRVGGISYRAMSPLYAGDKYEVRTSSKDADGKPSEILVERAGTICMKGEISV